MNYRMIFSTLGRIAIVLSVLLVIPAVLALSLGESSWWAIATTVGISLVIGLVLMLCIKPKDKVIFAKEGLIIVSLSWIYVSAIGALPFVISGAIPNYIDAFFEMCSGFSTTGATILTGDQIDAMYLVDKGLLFWRSFTHWIGGMGVIVFLMAFETGSSDRGMHILRAEMPGPIVDKIVPRARNTAKILYLLYIGFTVAEAIALIIVGACTKLPNGEMLSWGENIFDAVVHAFGTAGTGGFSVRGISIAYYGAAYQWIITVFMILFGINFNLYYLMLLRKFRQAFGSRELWIFIAIIVVSATALSINIATAVTDLPFRDNAHDVIRHSLFQVAAFISTTGYSSIPNGYNINNFPLLSLGILFLLMFIGGCAGSTGGGLKVSRVVILCKAVQKELRRVLHPRHANAVKFEGKIIADETLHGVTSYFGLYMLLLAATFIVLCFDGGTGLSVETNITAAVSCINNIGPAYGVAASGYYMYNWLSKIVMSFAMLIGRLEIYPILLMFSPTTWIKR
ncbi:MAG: TrkH family potassium uptake protein [Clostridiales bacterium]|nr:TrkH family potassium uptake protein [Clostridiales bacterium]